MNNKIIGRTLFSLLIIALAITLLPAGGLNSKVNNEVTTYILLPTIQCGKCEQNISIALDRVKGIISYDIDLDNKKMTVTYNDAIIDLSKIEKAITKAGYDANNKKADKKAYDKLDACCKVNNKE